jgi:hypothetical protein
MPPPQRVADHRRALKAQRPTEVAQGGERAERVIAGALSRAAVARQVDRHDVVLPGEPIEHWLPGAPVAADAVNQQQGGALAAQDIGDFAPVEANRTVIERHL